MGRSLMRNFQTSSNEVETFRYIDVHALLILWCRKLNFDDISPFNFCVILNDKLE